MGPAGLPGERGPPALATTPGDRGGLVRARGRRDGKVAREQQRGDTRQHPAEPHLTQDEPHSFRFEGNAGRARN